MFEDSLFASNSVSSPRRGWTALVSFFVQTLFIAVLIALPLLFTEALPLTHLTDYLTVPPSAAPPDTAQVVHNATHPPDSNMDQGHLLQPRVIPPNVIHVTDERPPVSALSDPDGGIYGSPGPSNPGNNTIATLLNNMHPSSVHPTLERPKKPVPISTGVSQGLLLRQVKPVYPPIALAAHVQGEVILQAVIGKDGTIQNLRVVSGHPMLIKAAAEAVQQWHYRPYLLNGEPVEVETQVRVTFTIS
jgi:periplasmic protein TonB